MLETKDFEEVHNMYNPDDCFKAFMRDINPLLISCFNSKKKPSKMVNAVRGMIMNYYFFLAKKIGFIKLMFKRKP